MDLFSEYLHPITSWVYLHPHWALLLTFLISCSESLAFIGSIIPGSVTMTAIGILAGSGLMRIDLTLIAAILGAIAGDSASYGLGRIFSDRLTNMWPFSRYPHWLNYGKDYFERHGGKSVLIGRFTGPLRSLIPIIAGMMGMNRWHFLAANVASAIGWSFLYVAPGILIGTASSELSPQSASKLFTVILCLLAAIWLLSAGIKWLFRHINQWLRIHLNSCWASALQHRQLHQWAQFITPCNEKNHYATAAMFYLLLCCLCLIPILIVTAAQSHWVTSLNESVNQFCLSIRTHDFDAFFIIVQLDISYISLLSFSVAIALYTTYYRDWRLLRFWISLIVISGLLVSVLSYYITSTIPHTAHISYLSIQAFPSTRLAISTALFGFLIFYLAAFYQQSISIVIRLLLLIALCLSGMALIYLGEDSIMNVVIAYITGFTNALAHWILYRRVGQPHNRSYLPISLSILLLIIATAVSSLLFFNKIADNQQPYTKQFVIHQDAWWHQQRPILPLYSTNRFGKKTGLMNLQYIGSITTLQQTLEKAGWKKQRDSFFYSLLLRAGKKNSAVSLPLMAQLFMNKKPYLMMTYGLSTDADSVIIRLWRSNYHVYNHNQAIWIGSIQGQAVKKHHRSDFMKTLLPALHDYKTQQIRLPSKIPPLPYLTDPVLLLIESNTELTND